MPRLSSGSANRKLLMEFLDMLILVSWAVQFVLAATGVIYVFRFRKKDKTVGDLIAAGPFVVLRPSAYVQAGKSNVPKIAFTASFVLFAITWFAVWQQSNF